MKWISFFSLPTTTPTNSITAVLESRGGFSLTEIVVSMGIGTLMVAGSMNFIEQFQKTKTEINERDKKRMRKFAHRFYGRAFLKITSEMSVSIPFFKLPILYKSTQNVCGTDKSGGCYMKLNNKNQISGLKQGMLKFSTSDSNTQKTGKGKYINFFGDEGGGWKTKAVRSGADAHVLRKVRYDKKVHSSKKERYFVGWNIYDDENPLYIMAEDGDADNYFQLDNYQGIDYGTFQDLMRGAGGNEFARNADALANSALMRIPETRTVLKASDLEAYKKRFYLFLHPTAREFYFIAYIDNLTKCYNLSTKKIEPACQNLYPIVAVNYDDDDSVDYTSFRAARNLAATNIVKEHDEGKKHLYLASFKFVPSIDWGPFSSNPKASANVYDLSKHGFWRGQRDGDSPYVPYRTTSVFSSGYIPWTQTVFKESIEKNVPLVVHYMLNILSMNERTINPAAPIWAPTTNIAVVPIKFYKLFMKKSDKGKQFLMETLVSDDNRKTRSVIQNLSGDATVVIARQLGTRRLSTFVKQVHEEDLKKKNRGTKTRVPSPENQKPPKEQTP